MQALPKNVVEEILRRRREGTSVSTIANEVGCSSQSVYNYLRTNSVVNHIYKFREAQVEKDVTAISLLRELYESRMPLRKISEITGVGRARISRILKSKGIEVKRHANCNTSFFKTIDSESKAYWLGFTAADGHVYGKGLSFNLGYKDASHLYRLRNALESGHKISFVRNAKSGKLLAMLCVSSKDLADDLRVLGMEQHKTERLAWPPKVPPEFLRHCIRGYVDGDGGWHHRQFVFDVTSTRFFLEGLSVFFAEHLGVNLARPRHAAGPAWKIVYGGRRQVQILHHFLYDSSSVYLERKLRAVSYEGLSGKSPRYAPDDCTKALELLGRGVSLQQVLSEIGCTRRTLWNWRHGTRPLQRQAPLVAPIVQELAPVSVELVA